MKAWKCVKVKARVTAVVLGNCGLRVGPLPAHTLDPQPPSTRCSQCCRHTALAPRSRLLPHLSYPQVSRKMVSCRCEVLQKEKNLLISECLMALQTDKAVKCVFSSKAHISDFRLQLDVTVGEAQLFRFLTLFRTTILWSSDISLVSVLNNSLVVI